MLSSQDINLTIGRNLGLFTSTETSSNIYSSDTSKSVTRSTNNSGRVSRIVKNNELTSGAAGSVNIAVGNEILAQFNSDSGRLLREGVSDRNGSVLYRDFSNDAKY